VSPDGTMFNDNTYVKKGDRAYKVK